MKKNTDPDQYGTSGKRHRALTRSVLWILFCCFWIPVSGIKCTRHYQKDLDFFQLRAGWKYYGSNSLSFSDTTFIPGKWILPESAPQLREWLKTGNARYLWCRNEFILDGHFTTSTLFLKLQTLPAIRQIILNQQHLKLPDDIIPAVNGTPLQKIIYRIDNPELHFGRKNTLIVGLLVSSLPDSIFAATPGIFSGRALLQDMGLPVEECPFRIERNCHAFLEDFAISWLKQDTMFLQTIFTPGNNETRGTVKQLVEAVTKRNPSEIEFYEPEFYCLPSRSSVIVLADWIFHYPGRNNESFPFSWELRKVDQRWYLAKLY